MAAEPSAGRPPRRGRGVDAVTQADVGGTDGPTRIAPAHERRSTMSDATPAAPTDQEVLITRIFEAPRERVFRAWTDPEEVAAWYGPEGSETPRDRIHIDLRVGGRYELTMLRPGGGGEFSIGYEIVELVEPELIVLRSDPMPQMGMHEPTVLRV